MSASRRCAATSEYLHTILKTWEAPCMTPRLKRLIYHCRSRRGTKLGIRTGGIRIG